MKLAGASMIIFVTACGSHPVFELEEPLELPEPGLEQDEDDDGDEGEIEAGSGLDEHEEPDPIEPPVLSECKEVQAESEVCLTFLRGRPALIGLDSGQLCPLDVSFEPGSGPGFGTVAWIGLHAYRCSPALQQIHLGTGAVRDTSIPCRAVIEENGALWITPDTGNARFVRYESFEHALDGRSSGEVFVPGFMTAGAAEGRIYSAWHSTNAVAVTELPSGDTKEVVLQGYDDWIFGLDGIGGDRFLILPPDRVGGARMYDASSGALIRVLEGFEDLQVLSCR